MCERLSLESSLNFLSVWRWWLINNDGGWWRRFIMVMVVDYSPLRRVSAAIAAETRDAAAAARTAGEVAAHSEIITE